MSMSAAEHQRLLALAGQYGNVEALEAALRRRIKTTLSVSEAIEAYKIGIINKPEARKALGFTTPQRRRKVTPS